MRIINRSIPTCVGLSSAGPCSTPQEPGPSPRAWGSRMRELFEDPDARSIPTCVGLSVRGRRGPSEHPGPSPRAWGSHPPVGADEPTARSIPTCVGLSVVMTTLIIGSPVHPHVRGALKLKNRLRLEKVGPSPRAWGSLEAGLRWCETGRSIPTCVGLSTQY